MQIDRSKAFELKDIPDMTEEEMKKAIEEFYKIIAKNMDTSIIESILKENKQLKEDFSILKKSQMISNDILNELEEWLKEQLIYFCENNEQGGFSTNVEDLEMILNKIQELKEKYK